MTETARTDPQPLRWSDRLRRAPTTLLLKILLVLLVVLAFSSAVTVVFENRLTRSALQAEARKLLAADLEVLQSSYQQRHGTLVTGLQSVAQRLNILGVPRARNRAEIVGELSDIARVLKLDTLQVVDADGEVVVSVGVPIAPLPAEALANASVTSPSQILRTGTGELVQAALLPVNFQDERYVVAGAFPFDDGAAFRLRRLIGGADIFLVAGGEVVATTFVVDPEALLAADRGVGPDGDAHSVTINGRETFIDSAKVAAAQGDWALDAAVGVAVREPVAALDSSLLRARVLAVALLVAVTIALAYVFFRIITRPLLRLSETAQRIASGEANVRFDADTGDEIAILADSLESMRGALEDQLNVIGNQAQALQEASERIVQARDEERRRLASDLHDGIQQQLVMLRVQLGFARRLLDIEPERGEEVWERMSGEVDAIIERLRETSQNIFPSILQDRGLQGALFSLAGRSAVPLIIAMEPDPFPRLSRLIEANAYFILSEAVTNVLKHADASNITVTVALRDDHLRLAVVDDGTGFDVGSLRSASALASIRDRVTALGGVLDVRSSPGEGTAVIAEFEAGSVLGALEVEQDRGDALVEVDGLVEPELAEDGVGVLLDGAPRDEEGVGDGRVVLPGGHQREHL